MPKRTAKLLIDALGKQAPQKMVDAIVVAVREKDNERLSFLGEVQAAIETARWKGAPPEQLEK